MHCLCYADICTRSTTNDSDDDQQENATLTLKLMRTRKGFLNDVTRVNVRQEDCNHDL